MMRPKRLLRDILRSAGFDVVRYADIPERPFRVLPYIVDSYVREHGRCSFVQIGASDGVRTDPLHQLVRKHGLEGLLIEPLPDMFGRLQENYAGCPGLRFENCAIGLESGSAAFYRFAPDAPIPDWAHGLASFDRGHLIRCLAHEMSDSGRFIVRESVPVRTLGEVLSGHGIEHVDLLQVDAEGFDCPIVHSALDLGLRPPIIQYEREVSSLEARAELKARLVSLGYRFIDVDQDTTAVLDPPGTDDDSP